MNDLIQYVNKYIINPISIALGLKEDEHKIKEFAFIYDDYERNKMVTEYVMERDKVTEYVMTRDRDNRTMSQILSDFENKAPKKEDRNEII